MATILVVDDRPLGRQFLKILLRHNGHQVLEAADGREALTRLDAGGIGLVISDILMPGMDGIELVRTMRARPALAEVPVMFFTASFRIREARGLAAELGIGCVLAKPAEPRQIIDCVNNALGLAPLPQVGESPSEIMEAGGVRRDSLDQILADCRVPIDHLNECINGLLAASVGSVAAERLRDLREVLEAAFLRLQTLGFKMSAMIELGMNLAVERDEERLAELFCHGARNLLTARLAIVGMLDAPGVAPAYCIAQGLNENSGDPIPIQPTFARALSDALRATGTVRRINPSGDPAMLGLPAEHPPVYSMLAAPIATNDRHLGWLYLANKMGAEGFSEEDEQIAVALATQMVAVYENVSLMGELMQNSERLRAEVEERRRTEATLAERTLIAELTAEVSLSLVAHDTLKSMLQHCAESLVRRLDADFAGIWRLDSQRQTLELEGSAGIRAALDGPHARIRMGEFWIGKIATDREPRLTNHVIGDPEVADQDWAVREGMTAFAGYPLVIDEQILGVIGAFARNGFSVFTLKALEAVAHAMALGMQRKLTEDRARRQMSHIAALRAIDMAIIGSFDSRVTLGVLLQHVMEDLRGDATAIFILDPRTQQLEYAGSRGFRSLDVRSSRIRMGTGLAGRVAFERRPLFIPALTGLHGELLQDSRLRGEGFTAYHGVPLIAKGELKGVLEVLHRGPHEADSEWTTFLDALAGQAAIAIDNAALFDGFQRSNSDLLLSYETTLEGWVKALDIRDKETEGHTRRVTEMTVQLAREMDFGEEELVHVRRGALLHDIGKLGIPDAVLLKPGPLTDDEWKIMRLHPVYAFEWLSPIPYLRRALDIPYCHHEKWDGSGYPRELKGTVIPLSARIFAIVDVWDALSSDRPYRPAWEVRRVREHIREGSGTHFDPQVVEAFLAMEGVANR